MSLKDQLKQKAHDNQIPEHPILDKNLDSSVIQSFLGGVAVAARLESNSMANKEKEALRNLGVSLKLNDHEIDDIINNINEISEAEFGNFLGEILPNLQENEVALYFITDFAKLLGINGKYPDDAQETLQMVGELLNIKNETLTFINEYCNYLLPGKAESAGEFLAGLSIELPEKYLAYYTKEGVEAIAKIKEQVQYYHHLIDLVEQEIGTHCYDIEEDIKKRSFADQEIIKNFTVNISQDLITTIKNCSNGISQIFLKNQPLVQSIASWVNGQFTVQYPTANLSIIHRKILCQLRQKVKEWELKKCDEPDDYLFSSSRFREDNGGSGFWSSDLWYCSTKSDYERTAEERFERWFKETRVQRVFRNACTKHLWERYHFASGDFYHSDSRTGAAFFVLILLSVASKNNEIGDFWTQLMNHPEQELPELNKDDLNKKLDYWATGIPYEYTYLIDCKDDSYGDGGRVNMEPAFAELRKDMKHAFDEIGRPLFEEATLHLRVTKDYFDSLFSMIMPMHNE